MHALKVALRKRVGMDLGSVLVQCRCVVLMKHMVMEISLHMKEDS